MASIFIVYSAVYLKHVSTVYLTMNPRFLKLFHFIFEKCERAIKYEVILGYCGLSIRNLTAYHNIVYTFLNCIEAMKFQWKGNKAYVMGKPVYKMSVFSSYKLYEFQWGITHGFHKQKVESTKH